MLSGEGQKPPLDQDGSLYYSSQWGRSEADPEINEEDLKLRIGLGTTRIPFSN